MSQSMQEQSQSPYQEMRHLAMSQEPVDTSDNVLQISHSCTDRLAADNKFAYDFKQTMAPFDFDPRNPIYGETDLYFSQNIKKLKDNAPALPLLSQNNGSVISGQINAIEQLYIQKLRNELLENRSAQNKVSLEKETYRKLCNKMAFLEQRSKSASSTLSRIPEKIQRAYNLQQSNLHQKYQKILQNDEIVQKFKNDHIQKKEGAYLQRIQDEQQRLVYLDQFHQANLQIQNLKSQKLQKKLSSEKDFLEQQKVDFRESVQNFQEKNLTKSAVSQNLFQTQIQNENLQKSQIHSDQLKQSKKWSLRRSENLEEIQKSASQKLKIAGQLKQQHEIALQEELLEKQKKLLEKSTREQAQVENAFQTRKSGVQTLIQLQNTQQQQCKAVYEEFEKTKQEKYQQLKNKEQELIEQKMRKKEKEFQLRYSEHCDRMIAQHYLAVKDKNEFQVPEELQDKIPADSILRLGKEDAMRLVLRYEEEKAAAYNLNKPANSENVIQRRKMKYSDLKVGNSYNSSLQQYCSKVSQNNDQTFTSSQLAQSEVVHKSTVQQQLLEKKQKIESLKAKYNQELQALMQLNKKRENERQQAIKKVSNQETAQKLNQMFDQEIQTYQLRVQQLKEYYDQQIDICNK